MPAWLDPHVSLDGIAAILTLLVAGGAALWRVLRRFDRVEGQSRANANVLLEHGVKLDQMIEIQLGMERANGRMNMLEQIQMLQGKRIDELTAARLQGSS